MVAALAALAVANASTHLSLFDRLMSWDATYYVDIANNGYPRAITVVDGQLVEGARFAFSPLYPALAAGLHAIGVPTRLGLLLISVITGLAASVFVHLLARRMVGTRRAGYIACALLGALPSAIALQMGYAESLALALSAASLVAALRGRWWLAGALAGLATLTRPTALVVALAIPVAAWASRDRKAVKRWRVAAATALGMAGAPMYWAFVWLRTGRPTGWFVVQETEWHSRFDFFAATWRFLTAAPRYSEYVVVMFAFATVIAAVVAVIIVVRRPVSPPLAAVAVAAVVVALGSSNSYASKPRILLAAFPLVVLASRALSRLPDKWIVPGIVGAVALSTGVGAYQLAQWPHAI
jgi:Gpi18-like mannosyltransferase